MPALVARVVLGSNGTLYGTTHAGGQLNCGVPGFQYDGCGTVFKLAPQVIAGHKACFIRSPVPPMERTLGAT